MSDLGNKEVFSKNLKYYMEKYNKTRNDIAQITNIPYSTVSSWCNALYYPRIDKIEMLANYFNILKSDLVEDKISDNEQTNKFYMVPVYGQISAGQPNWAEECLEGYLPIDPNLMGIINPEECFFLKVNGESMNKVVRNGAYALIRKQDSVEDGEIAVVLVNGYTATLKHFTQKGDIVVLEPDSTVTDDPDIKTQIYDKNTPIKILGKYIGKFEIN
jgi:repressor LexA